MPFICGWLACSWSVKTFFSSELILFHNDEQIGRFVINILIFQHCAHCQLEVNVIRAFNSLNFYLLFKYISFSSMSTLTENFSRWTIHSKWVELKSVFISFPFIFQTFIFYSLSHFKHFLSRTWCSTKAHVSIKFACFYFCTGEHTKNETWVGRQKGRKEKSCRGKCFLPFFIHCHFICWIPSENVLQIPQKYRFSWKDVSRIKSTRVTSNWKVVEAFRKALSRTFKASLFFSSSCYAFNSFLIGNVLRSQKQKKKNSFSHLAIFLSVDCFWLTSVVFWKARRLIM